MTDLSVCVQEAQRSPICDSQETTSSRIIDPVRRLFRSPCQRRPHSLSSSRLEQLLVESSKGLGSRVRGSRVRESRVKGSRVRVKSSEVQVKESNSLQRDRGLRSTVLSSGRSSDVCSSDLLPTKHVSATATLTIFFQARATSDRVVQRVGVEGKGFKSKSKEFRGSGSRRATVSRGIKGLGQRS